MVPMKFLHSLLLLAGIVLCNSASILQRESPVVKTLSGSLRGIIGESREGREFYEYFGIPYAKPPIGSLRFEMPQPADKWDGVRDASKFGAECLQVDIINKNIIGDENCLFLNVFTPKLPRNKNDALLPVMVWIHGGYFVYGSANLFGPEYFMDHDIVLVTINYRLGTLGFLNAGETSARGNQALRDQNLALKWVQQNIKRFGGDPGKVTLFGESAGADCVHHHILSPLSKGLFQKALSQSGSALANWGTRNNGVEQTKKFCEIVGCPTNNSTNMVECLRRVDGLKILEARLAAIVDDLRDPITIFSPSIELIKDEYAFITEDPSETIRKGNFNRVPWITGTTSQEGLLVTIPFLRDSKFKKIYENFDVHIPHLLWYTGPPNPEALDKIKEFYFGAGNVNPDFQNWTNIFTDFMFGEPAQRAISGHSKHAPVYAYTYNYEGRFTVSNFLSALTGRGPLPIQIGQYFIPRWFNRMFRRIEPKHLGPAHGDDLGVLFPFHHMGLKLYNIRRSHKDYDISKKMVKSWVGFASDPSSSLPVFDNIEWPQANSQGKTLKYMEINIKSSLVDQPNEERYRFAASLNLTNFPTQA